MIDLDREIGDLPFMLELDDYLRARAVAAIREVASPSRLPQGTVLFSSDDTSSADGYVVLAGNVVIEGSDGFTKTVLPTCLLGEMCQFDFDGKHHRMATVRAEDPVEVLHFSWTRLYEQLATTCNAEEVQEFRTALRHYAWMHYMDLQGEL